ncbi:MAG: hypothetical protein AAGK02_13475 [Pseudomonadota bacterium]
MKAAGWLSLAAVLLIGLVIVSYFTGYQVGEDIAEAENRAEEAE